jgi:SAM-dependent methyltransferase
MTDFLARVRQCVDDRAPNLRPLYDRMSSEARFARAWLDEDLRALPKGAAVLEVGGGTFLLSCQLAQEGFDVTTIEPTGTGFDAFEELGALALSLAKADRAEPRIVRCNAEEFKSGKSFLFAFSVNVMEHVRDPGQVMSRVSAALRPGGAYRFLCPNYLFPYEPHFNIPTFGTKALTWRLLRRRIERNPNVRDPQGLWQSLNWISVPRVKRIARAMDPWEVAFRKRTFVAMIERAVDDGEFASRRAAWMLDLIRMMKSIGLLGLAARIPASLQPIMDVRMTQRH